MKKLLMALLGAAVALDLVFIIGMLGENISLRQMFYTVTDKVMNGFYRLRQRWSLRTFLH